MIEKEEIKQKLLPVTSDKPKRKSYSQSDDQEKERNGSISSIASFFPFPKQDQNHSINSSNLDYDEETNGNYLKYLLNQIYLIPESILLGKVYQVAPWKTGRYLWKSQRTFLFPLKLWSHIILIVLMSCLLLFMNNQYGSYQRGMAMVTCGFFLPKEKCDYSECVGYLTNQANSLDSYSCSLYKKRDVLTAIDRAIDSYYRINETSLSQFVIPMCGDEDDGECARSYGLHDCQPNDHVHGATLKLYKYNSDRVISTPLTDVYHSINRSIAHSFTNQNNYTSLRLLELHLPLLDRFITDNYQAVYQWNIIVKYEFDTKVRFDVSVEKKIKRICNIDTSTHALFATQSIKQVNNLNEETVSLVSLQGIMNILAILIIIISCLYLIILLYETIQNLRLVCFTADVMSYNPFISTPEAEQLTSMMSPMVGDLSLSRSYSFENSQSSLKYQMHRIQPTTWKEYLLDWISIGLRYLLRIPSRYYLNDFPRLYRMITTHLDLEVPLKSHEKGLKGKDEVEQHSIAENYPDQPLSYQEMKEFYQLTHELYRFAPEDLYSIPSSDLVSTKLHAEINANPCIPENQENSNKIQQNQPFSTEKTIIDASEKEQSTSEPEVKIDEEYPSSLPKDEKEDQLREEQRINLERQLKIEKLATFRRRSLEFWNKLSVKVKMRLLDGWRLLSCLTCILTMYALITFLQVSKGYYLLTSLSKSRNEDDTSFTYTADIILLLLGIALFLQYFTLLNYLRYSNRFTTATIILWSAFFKVQRIIISILPLAFGLMFLGILLFGNSNDSFGSMTAILVTIFSVMNCDSIWDTFNDTNSSENSTIIGTIYVTVIFIIFSYLMLRLILAVVESLYFYFRLYSNLRRKRLLFRKKHLVDVSASDPKRKKIPTLKVRTHNSDQITKSLFHIYTKELQEESQRGSEATK